MDDLLLEKLKEVQKLIGTPGMPSAEAAALGHMAILTMILVELREIKEVLAAKP